MPTLKDRLYHTLYATSHPPQRRTQPMQVLAVGISRSGTESLRNALHMLGIEHTWHGYDSILPPYSLEEWYKLAAKKWAEPAATGAEADANGLKVTREDFDVILGSCVGVSDLPGAAFARELVFAYPEAKVILNSRGDMEGWRRSFEVTLGTFDGDRFGWEWCKSWFCAELFWARQYMSRTQLPGFFRGSFASNGVWVYQEHLAMVRGLGLPRDRLLEWTAADGWEPLCEFLGKDVPTEAFPQGNPTTEWVERVGATMQEHNRRAVRNMLVFFAMLIACVSWVGYVVGLGV